MHPGVHFQSAGGHVLYSCFGRISAAVACKHTNARQTNPNSTHELTCDSNFDPANEVLEGTGLAAGYITQRYKDLHGKIFAQLPKDFRYRKTTKGQEKYYRYTLANLKYDLRNRYL